MPVTNIPAELSEMFAVIMADCICVMALNYEMTPDELLEQIQQRVEALKDIAKRNHEQEVSKRH